MMENFDKKLSGGTVKNEIISSKELDEELHKPIIIKFSKRKVHSPFIDNIWVTDLANMQLISSFNKGLDYVLLIFIVNMHGLFLKKVAITNAFQKN